MSVKNIVLPDIGEGVTEGEMVKWLVQIGDSVEEDQPVAEIMTDKATVEVPSPISGTVKELKASEGDVIPIETTLLVLDTTNAVHKTHTNHMPHTDHIPHTKEAVNRQGNHLQEGDRTQEHHGQEDGQERHKLASVDPPVAQSQVLATPGTRRLAREMNIDINALQGTGSVGRVTRDDVLRAKASGETASASISSVPTASVSTSSSQALSPPFSRQIFSPLGDSKSLSMEEERVPLRGIRRKIAEQMQMTKQIVPHFTLMDEANVSELYEFRKQAKEIGKEYGVHVTFLPFIMKALIATLREFPEVNATIDDEAQEIVYKKYYHIGFATDTPKGLLVPNIKNANSKTILQLSHEITELANKARKGELPLENMKGATVTITNIGSVGGTYATPIINHPEVAILGVYKMTDKPLFKDGQFFPVKVMNFTITCDHRLIDGAVAARFLSSFIKRIESPSHLMLDMV